MNDKNPVIAIFEIDLPKMPGVLMAHRPKTDHPQVSGKINGFDVHVSLEHTPNTPCIQNPSDPDALFYFAKAVIQVKKIDDEVPEDQFQRINYFWQRAQGYLDAAVIALNRVILYFKYRLQNPRLRQIHPLELANRGLSRPKWLDHQGKQIEIDNIDKLIGTVIIIETNFVTLGSFGIRKLTKDNDLELANALVNPITPKLYEEILSDSQAAALEGNLRRALLELTIACEIFIKQSFFRETTVPGLAYEYLEDKGKINVRSIDMIDQIAKHVFGESFKETHPVHFTNMDHMFRCRNKIAHRGEATYRDDKGSLNTLNPEVLAEWWDSFSELVSWLESRLTNL